MNVPHYHSYLIRLWTDMHAVERNADWRIELESIQTGQIHLFSEPEAVLDFLREQFRLNPKLEEDDVERN